MTLRDASSTWITGCASEVYCGAIFTAVCMRLVVAPPMSSGTLMPCLPSSRAKCTISSSEGVMSPERPITSTRCSRAAARIVSALHITPMSITL